MAEFQNMDMTLSVKDDATATLKKAAEAQRDLTDAMNDARDASKQSGEASRSIAGDVFKGVAAWDLAKQAITGVKDAIVELAMAGVDDERSMTRVNSTLVSAGVASQAAKDAVDKFKGSMVDLGFDGDTAEQSMARLIATTGNVEQAQKLGGLAADLAADRQISLSEATTVLNQVVTGNQRVLKSYGVTMDDNASSAEALAALQEKVGGRAKDMASDTQGAIDIAKSKWDEIKDTIGSGFTPVVKESFDWLNKQMSAILGSKESMEKLQRGAYGTGQFLKGLGLTIWAIIKTFGSFGATMIDTAMVAINVAKDMSNAFFSVGDNLKAIVSAAAKALTGDFAGAADTLKDRVKAAFAGTTASMAQFSADQDILSKDVTDAWTSAAGAFDEAFTQQNFKTATDATSDASNKIKTSFAGIGAAGGKSSTEVAAAKKKIADAMNGLSTDYRDVEGDIEESLAKLETAHVDTVDTISKKIGDLKGQLLDLKDTYNATVAGFDKSQAEGVVGQEQRISDLKKQLQAAKIDYADSLQAGNPDGSRMAELQSQLDKEQSAYDTYIGSNKVSDADLAEARRRAGETQFERDMEDIAARRKEAQAEYDEKKAQLDLTVKAEQDALAAEQIVYQAKRDQYAATAKAAIEFKDQYVAALADMQAQTDQSANAMKAKLDEIKNTLAQIESARNAAKIASASGAGVSGGTSKVEVNIDLGGVAVNSAADADALVKKMSDQLMNTLRLAGLASG